MLTGLGVRTTEEKDRELDRLLIQVGQGDREAFARLYGLTRGAVYALALSLLRDAHEAQDVAQDVYVKVWESAPTYRPRARPWPGCSPWPEIWPGPVCVRAGGK